MSISHTRLGLPASERRHGYELKRASNEHFGHARPLNHRQVYSTMARLQRNGLGEVDGVEAGGGPERKRYAITDAGVTDVEDRLGRHGIPGPYFRTTLRSKVVPALLTDRSAEGLLDAQRAEHLRPMRGPVRRKSQGNLADGTRCPAPHRPAARRRAVPAGPQ